MSILNVVLIILFALPPVFQLVFGSKATNPACSFKFWKVCLISICGLILGCAINLFLMTQALRHSGSRDGLPIITILIIEAFLGSAMLAIILIQFLILRYKNRTS
jgi:uncharacterized membrane-anchored protein YitT (DUF2179 family)